MPARLRAWYTAAEIEALAARRTELSGSFPVADMLRLAAALGAVAGTVDVRIVFAQRDPGWLALAIRIQTCLGVTCQRCLGPLELEIDEQVEFGFVPDEDSIGLLPEAVEPVAPDGDRLNLLQLVEDELIVAAPMVPKHAAEQCSIDVSVLPEGVSAQEDTASRD